MEQIVGLDFGAFAAKVAVLQPQRPTPLVIANKTGMRSTVLAVATPTHEGSDHLLLAESAEQRSHKNLRNTLRHVLPLLGTSSVSDVHPRWRRGMKVQLEESDGDLQVGLRQPNGVTTTLTMRQAACHLLQHVRSYTDEFLHLSPPRACVLVLPTYVSECSTRRQLLLEAANEAGWDVRHTVRDSVAICVAHGLDQSEGRQQEHCLVIDMAHSRTCVSLLSRFPAGTLRHIDSTTLDVSIDSDLDDALVRFMARKARQAPSRIADIDDRPRSLALLRKEARRARHALARSAESLVSVDSLADGVPFQCRISGGRFDNMVSDYVVKVRRGADALLSKHGISPDRVLLAGGAANLPSVKRALQQHFMDANVMVQNDAEETAARGAAVLGEWLSRHSSVAASKTTETATVPTLPVSVSLRLGEDKQLLFNRGTVLPCVRQLDGLQFRGQADVLVSGTQAPVMTVQVDSDTVLCHVASDGSLVFH
ncbi:MAG: hypothetical protein MHM6MM_000418 [Cercozoa sp. M6MM]